MWIIFTFGTEFKTKKMDWLAYFLRDILVWSFEHLLEPLGNTLNYTFLFLGFAGLFFWLKMQAKYNAEAEANPDQIK